MARIKVTQEVVNRGGKRYVAVDGYIEVSEEDIIFFDGFKVDTPKVEINPKKKKNENIKKED